MEVVRETAIARQGVRAADAELVRIAGTVKGAVDRGRFAADVFQDIDLPTVRPANLLDLVAKHPERRPQSLTVRNLDARLDAAIGHFEAAQRVDARRCELPSDAVETGVVFFERPDG